MEHITIPVISGIIRDFHERIIPDNKASEATNIMFENGRFKTRWGYSQIGSAVYDSSPVGGGGVMQIVDYATLKDGTRRIIAITTSDAFELNQDTAAWNFITKNYNSGTVTISATGLVSLSATTSVWDSTTLEANRMEIKFGTTDMNVTPTTNYFGASGDGADSKWWKVSALASATSLRLVTATGSAVATAVSYVLRDMWSGDTDDEMDYAFPYDTATAVADKVLVVTNGIENVMEYTGTGSFTWMDTDSNVCKHINYFGAVGFEHLIESNIVSGADLYPQMLANTSAGRINTWATRNNSYELLNDNNAIVGMEELRGRIMVYKTESITEMWADPNGNNDDPFNFIQNKIINIGTPSIRTVANLGNYHIFFGSDNNVYLFDGVSVQAIGDEIVREIDGSIDRVYIARSFAAHVKEQNWYILFVPTTEDGTGYPAVAYVHNYKEKTWTKWEFAHNMTAFGIYKKQTTQTIDSLTGVIDTFKWRIDDLKTIENKNRYLLADSSGNVYGFEERYYTDNGTNISATLETKDFPMNDSKHTCKILELEVGFNKVVDPASSTATSISSVVNVQVSPDFAQNWSTAAQITEDWTGLTDDYRERIFNFVERGKQARFRVTNVSGAPFDLEAIRLGFNPSMGKVR